MACNTHHIVLFVIIFGISVCAASPANIQYSQENAENSDPNASNLELLSVVTIATTFCIVLAVIGCACCYGRGFAKFEETTTTESVVGQSYTNFNDFSPPTESTPSYPPGLEPDTVTIEPLPDVSTRALVSPIGSLGQQSSWMKAGMAESGQGELKHLDNPRFQFARSQLSYVDEMGSGWFGKVLQGEAHRLHTGLRKTRVVIKQLRDTATAEEQVLFLQEVQPYREVNHPNVLLLLGQCIESMPFLLMLEYAPFGDLKGYLQKHADQIQDMAHRDVQLRLACDMVSGLMWLHQADFIHIDLAARNCLVCADTSVKIGDYGISLEKYPDDYYITKDKRHAVPIRWLGPEVIEITQNDMVPKKVTKESNVWSFGVIMLELCTGGQKPYPKLTNEEVLKQVVLEQEIRLDKPTLDVRYASRWFEIMMFCWLESDMRPTMKEVHELLMHLRSNKDRIEMDDFQSRWDALKPSAMQDSSDSSREEAQFTIETNDPIPKDTFTTSGIANGFVISSQDFESDLNPNVNMNHANVDIETKVGAGGDFQTTPLGDVLKLDSKADPKDDAIDFVIQPGVLEETETAPSSLVLDTDEGTKDIAPQHEIDELDFDPFVPPSDPVHDISAPVHDISAPVDVPTLAHIPDVLISSPTSPGATSDDNVIFEEDIAPEISHEVEAAAPNQAMNDYTEEVDINQKPKTPPCQEEYDAIQTQDPGQEEDHAIQSSPDQEEDDTIQPRPVLEDDAIHLHHDHGQMEDDTLQSLQGLEQDDTIHPQDRQMEDNAIQSQDHKESEAIEDGTNQISNPLFDLDSEPVTNIHSSQDASRPFFDGSFTTYQSMSTTSADTNILPDDLLTPTNETADNDKLMMSGTITASFDPFQQENSTSYNDASNFPDDLFTSIPKPQTMEQSADIAAPDSSMNTLDKTDESMTFPSPLPDSSSLPDDLFTSTPTIDEQSSLTYNPDNAGISDDPSLPAAEGSNLPDLFTNPPDKSLVELSDNTVSDDESAYSFTSAISNQLPQEDDCDDSSSYHTVMTRQSDDPSFYSFSSPSSSRANSIQTSTDGSFKTLTDGESYESDDMDEETYVDRTPELSSELDDSVSDLDGGRTTPQPGYISQSGVTLQHEVRPSDTSKSSQHSTVLDSSIFSKIQTEVPAPPKQTMLQINTQSKKKGGLSISVSSKKVAMTSVKQTRHTLVKGDADHVQLYKKGDDFAVVQEVKSTGEVTDSNILSSSSGITGPRLSDKAESQLDTQLLDSHHTVTVVHNVTSSSEQQRIIDLMSAPTQDFKPVDYSKQFDQDREHLVDLMSSPSTEAFDYDNTILQPSSSLLNQEHPVDLMTSDEGPKDSSISQPSSTDLMSSPSDEAFSTILQPSSVPSADIAHHHPDSLLINVPSADMEVSAIKLQQGNGLSSGGCQPQGSNLDMDNPDRQQPEVATADVTGQNEMDNHSGDETP